MAQTRLAIGCWAYSRCRFKRLHRSHMLSINNCRSWIRTYGQNEIRIGKKAKMKRERAWMGQRGKTWLTSRTYRLWKWKREVKRARRYGNQAREAWSIRMRYLQKHKEEQQVYIKVQESQKGWTWAVNFNNAGRSRRVKVGMRALRSQIWWI